jgi:TPR repeat protein
MSIHVKVLGLYLMLAGFSLAWAGLDEGVEAYRAGDYPTALKEFRALAKKGDAPAQYNLGNMYRQGHGVPQDDAEAAKWYGKSAEQGLADAQLNLGYLYQNGKGVSQDYAEAVRWYRKSAEQRNQKAQFNLGLMYSSGQGVPQDFVLAHMWFNLAGVFGSTDARELRDLTAEKMTSAQIAEAQKLAREWTEKH